MAYNITKLLNDLATTIHGTTINKVPNVYGIINRAARDVILDVDPKETQRIVPLASVFNSVYDYALPDDVKGDRIIDIRPQAGRIDNSVFTQGYSQDFDTQKYLNAANKVYVQWNTGVKTIRIEDEDLPTPVTLTDTGSTTGWTATSGASNITVDTTNNVAGAGAITFDLDTTPTSGSIQCSTLPPLDLTGHVNIDTLFYWVYIPNASGVTSFTLRWGSDISANYYTYTSTTTAQGNAFVNGWNLISAPWASATKVGSPTVTAYDSVQLIVNYNGVAQTGFKFCNLTSNTGYIYNIVYYSKYLFRNPLTNAFQEEITDSTESNRIINLDTESYNLLFTKVAFYVAQSLQGADSTYDADFWQTEYNRILDKYRHLNPSEAMLKGSSYYNIPNKHYSRFGSRYYRR